MRFLPTQRLGERLGQLLFRYRFPRGGEAAQTPVRRFAPSLSKHLPGGFSGCVFYSLPEFMNFRLFGKTILVNLKFRLFFCPSTQPVSLRFVSHGVTFRGLLVELMFAVFA